MPDAPETLRTAEYVALRDTIRQRGSLRVTLTVITVSVWAATILTVCVLYALPFFSLVPLLVLVTGFEAAFALHLGVERIGRYIQVHHEPRSSGQARWEEAAMGFRGPGGAAHPLFPAVFAAAALINLTLGTLYGLDAESASLFDKPPLEIVPVVVLHGVFLLRLGWAVRFAAGQRARDLDEYRRLLDAPRS
jgi:hypothetical protein